jgi:hypothetical protein
MNTTQWLVLGLIIMIIVGVIAYQMMGSDGGTDGTGGNGDSSKPASLSSPEMTLTIDSVSAAPAEPQDIFAPDDLLFCSVKLSDGTPKTRVKAEWMYLGSGTDGESKKLYETEGTFKGTRYVSFSLSDDEGLKTGAYEVILYLDGKEKFRVPFTVE